MDVPTLTDGTVSLDALRPDDADLIVSTDDEPTRWAFGDRAPMTLAAAKRLVQRAADQWRRGSSWRCFAIRRANESRYVGRLLLRPRRLPVYLVEIVVAPDHRGDRIGRRAVRLACRYAFEDLSAETIEADTRVGHLASQRTLIAVGFEATDAQRSDVSGHRSVGRLTAERWHQLNP